MGAEILEQDVLALRLARQSEIAAGTQHPGLVS
jgi:hypothetical protein